MRFLLLLIMATSLHAGWLDRKAEGWAWYEDEQLAEPEQEARKPASSAEQLAEIREDLEERLATALLDPNPDNIGAYLSSQKYWVDQSAVFARGWSRFLLTHPHLDERSLSPVSQYGIQVRKQEKQQARERLLRSLAAEHGLFFFYEGDSPYSQAFARVVSAFAHQYGWNVLAVTLDGKALPEYPRPRLDNGISTEFQVPSTPALYVVNPKRSVVVPIAYGLLSLQQIEENVALQFDSEAPNG